MYILTNKGHREQVFNYFSECPILIYKAGVLRYSN